MAAGLFDTAGQEPLDRTDGQDAEGRYRAIIGLGDGFGEVAIDFSVRAPSPA